MSDLAQGDGDHLVGQVHGLGAVGVVAGFHEESGGLAVAGEELFGDVGELAVLEGVGGQEEAAGGVGAGAGARRVLQLGGDLAHPAEHFDVAVGQGVHAGGQGLGARGELADAVLESADVTGQVGGVTERAERLVQ